MQVPIRVVGVVVQRRHDALAQPRGDALVVEIGLVEERELVVEVSPLRRGSGDDVIDAVPKLNDLQGVFHPELVRFDVRR